MKKYWLNKFEDEVVVDKSVDKVIFTPEQQVTIDNLVAVEKKRAQQALDELKNLQAKASLTTKERTDLDKRVETLQNELLTKEELAKRERDKLINESETIKKQLETERDDWRSKYTDSTIQRSLVDAALKYKARNPQHIVALLKNNTDLTEEIDKEGKTTGNLIPKVKLTYTDDKGKVIPLEFTADDAVRHLSEQKEHFNLFDDGTPGGFGFSKSQIPDSVDLREMSKDPESYRKNRDAILKNVK